MGEIRRFFLFFLFSLLLSAGFFGFNTAASENIIINEVQIEGSTASDDFIELYNPTCEDIDLSGWKLRKRTSVGSESSIGTLKNTISAKGYYLWANTKDGDLNNCDYSTKTYYLSQDYSIALFDSENKQIDSLTWGTNSNPFSDSFIFPNNPLANESIERISINNFELQKAPSPKNSAFQKDADECDTVKEKPPLAYSDKIRINEFLPAPSSGEEFIELYNPTEQKEDLSGWILRDASKTGKHVFPFDTFIESEDYLVIYKKDFKFALNNSGEESLTLSDPAEKEVSKITYNGSKKDLSYNFDGVSWRWSKFLTPGEENIFNNLPTISSKKTNTIYVNVYADFSAEGGDADKDALKYTWDFGDGHKSYKAKTRHKYTELGKYTATLKVSDGSEDVLTTFDIEVVEFPKLKIKIIALAPNPSGKDTGSEYITLKNETKKKINLKGWGIAAGWKDLINHPVREDFKIKAGKSKNLTNEFASIALNNTKSKIELRDPSGRVIDKVKYEKKDGVPDDAIYEKIKKKWQWNEKSASPATEETKDVEPEAILPEVLENTEDINVELDIPDEEIQANLGKSSLNPEWQKKKENKILLASADSHLKITLPEPQGQVLGASTIYMTENYYSFTSPTIPEKHWAVKIWESFNSSINSLLRQF